MHGVFAPQNAAARAAGVPTATVGHGTVSGSLTENGIPMAGKDHEFSLGGLYAALSTATMLGHIHRHQSWERQIENFMQRVAYPGSIGRFHYGEEGKKGFLIWNVGSHNCDFDFHETPARVMVDFLFDGIPDLGWLEGQAPSCAGSFVRVRYSVDAELAASVDKQAIELVLAQAAEVRIEPKLLVSQRQRCSGISTLPTLVEKVEKWCESTQNDAALVVPRVHLLATSDAKSIATNLIKEFFHEAEDLSRKPRCDVGLAVDTVSRAEFRLDQATGRALAQ
jgi:exonuclease SbcD